MKRVLIIINLYMPVALGFEAWCQSLVLRTSRPYLFSYKFEIKDPHGNPIAATRCYVALTEQEQQMLYNTFNMFSNDTQLRSITTVKDSLLALFGQQVIKARGANATVEDALKYLEGEGVS